MNGDGFLNMCGHGSIGIMMLAVTQELVSNQSSPVKVVLETPAGLVTGFVEYTANGTGEVTLHGVPSFLMSQDIEIRVDRDLTLSVDVAHGGNFFGLIDAQQLDASLEEMTTRQLKEIAAEVCYA